jgi:Putative inner membrane protein of Enterobacteriaceae.
LNIKHNWAGVISCFLLFIVVCLVLAFNVKGAFRAEGHAELGLLFFIFPGAAASFLSRGDEVVKPLIGAMLAAPLCLLLLRLLFVTSRSFWQEMAWLLSAVFWCALGALCFLFIRALIERVRRHK